MDYFLIYWIGAFFVTIGAIVLHVFRGSSSIQLLSPIVFLWPLAFLILTGALVLDLLGYHVIFLSDHRYFTFRRYRGSTLKGFTMTLFRFSVRVWVPIKKLNP